MDILKEENLNLRKQLHIARKVINTILGFRISNNVRCTIAEALEKMNVLEMEQNRDK